MTLCYVQHQTHSEFWHIQHSVFSGICRHIHSRSALLRHIHWYSNIINTYSGLFSHIQHPVQPSHIHNLAIFWALAYLESKAYLKPCELLTRNIQNPAIGHYWAMFKCIFRTLCNTCIRRNMAYSESWNIQNPFIIASRCIFRTLSYLRKFTNIQNSELWTLDSGESGCHRS